MARRRGISIRQRRVSAELRSLRKERGLSCREIGSALGCSESKISRMETGDRGLYADDVAAILGFLQAPADTRHELLALVRDGEERNWHEIHGKLPTNWKDLIGFENDATAIYNYEPLVVPGLAQTAEYSRTIIHGSNPRLTESEVEALVSVRLTRQLILSRRTAPTVHLILDEMILRRPVGETGMFRAQLRHLHNLAQRPRINIQIVPFDAGAHPGLTGSSVILEFPSEPSLAYVETRGTSSFLEEEEQVLSARLAWQGIRAIALSAADSARLIASSIGSPKPYREHER